MGEKKKIRKLKEIKFPAKWFFQQNIQVLPLPLITRVQHSKCTNGEQIPRKCWRALWINTWKIQVIPHPWGWEQFYLFCCFSPQCRAHSKPQLCSWKCFEGFFSISKPIYEPKKILIKQEDVRIACAQQSWKSRQEEPWEEMRWIVGGNLFFGGKWEGLEVETCQEMHLW